MTTSINYDMAKSYPKNQLIVMLEQYDLTTTRDEINQVKRLWNQGKSIYDIADTIRPTPRGRTETFLLLLHMADTGVIAKRDGMIWGR